MLLVAPAARLECWIQHPSGKNRYREAFSFLDKQVTRNSLPQILATCAKILRLSNFQKVPVLYSLVVPIGSPKAAPTAPTHFQTIPDPPHPSPFPPAPGTASHSPPAPPLCPGTSGAVLTPDFLSPLPAPPGAIGVSQGGQEPPQPLLRGMAQQLCCQRSSGFPGDSRDRGRQEPPWP